MAGKHKGIPILPSAARLQQQENILCHGNNSTLAALGLPSIQPDCAAQEINLPDPQME